MEKCDLSAKYYWQESPTGQISLQGRGIKLERGTPICPEKLQAPYEEWAEVQVGSYFNPTAIVSQNARLPLVRRTGSVLSRRSTPTAQSALNRRKFPNHGHKRLITHC